MTTLFLYLAVNTVFALVLAVAKAGSLQGNEVRPWWFAVALAAGWPIVVELMWAALADGLGWSWPMDTLTAQAGRRTRELE